MLVFFYFFSYSGNKKNNMNTRHTSSYDSVHTLHLFELLLSTDINRFGACNLQQYVYFEKLVAN